MKNFKIAFLAFIITLLAAGGLYFYAMHAGGNLRISSNNQDWGGFGSYFGGVLAPAASLLAGYMVYISFASNAHQQKLILARESISRLDLVLEMKLDAPFNNPCLGEIYYGLPLRKVIYAVSNNEITTTESMDKAILSLLHNVAIMTNSIRYYMNLLDEFPSTKKDSQWLGRLEQSYWIEKYSAVCSRMVRVVGQSAFEAKASAEELRSFNMVLRGE
ncbi:hypothetical protein [Pseudomonas synxantha]|uniref:hypothetical protein n=1 Tax=Pseudomonas synxantha TaxID=47883 RepID=UPI002792A094|nr:hypothetical protein [Pseudomonas synxantha]MDQ0978531.1 hypothetical protein [Pseudomonas synxantha]